MTNIKNLRIIAILLAVVLTTYLASPFITGGLLGLFLAMGTWGLRDKAKTLRLPSLPLAIMATTLLTLMVFIPVGWLTLFLLERGQELVASFEMLGKDWVAFSKFAKNWPLISDWFDLSWRAVKTNGVLGVVTQKIDKAMIASMAGNAGVFLMARVFDAIVALAAFCWLWHDDSWLRALKKSCLWLGGRTGLEMLSMAFVISRGILAGFIILGLIEGAALGMMLRISGMPYGLLIGFLIGFSAALPIVAPILAGCASAWIWFFIDPVWGFLTGVMSLFVLTIADPMIRAKMTGKTDAGMAATLVGMLGGISSIGLPGLFLGPICFAFLSKAAKMAGKHRKISQHD